MTKSTCPIRRPISDFGTGFRTRSCDPTPKRNVVGKKTISDAKIILEIEQLSQNVTRLEQEVEKLKQAVLNQTATIFISSLGVPDIKVIKPIPVTIEKESDEEYIASFMDANISTGGKSGQEAVYNLQSLIADLFEMHEEETSELGPAMKIQNQVLHDVLCRQ